MKLPLQRCCHLLLQEAASLVRLHLRPSVLFQNLQADLLYLELVKALPSGLRPTLIRLEMCWSELC